MSMRIQAKIVIVAVCALLVSCSTAPKPPSYQYLQGGERVTQPGVSYVLPATHKDWIATLRTTYQSAFAALGTQKYDTLIVASIVYKIEPSLSKLDFLHAVKTERNNEPDTGQYELIRNTEDLYEDRSETCVIYKSAYKDFGVNAKRGGEYSIYETIGMHCIYPYKSDIAILIELSRKAPPEMSYPNFEKEGLEILQSVKFVEF